MFSMISFIVSTTHSLDSIIHSELTSHLALWESNQKNSSKANSQISHNVHIDTAKQKEKKHIINIGELILYALK